MSGSQKALKIISIIMIVWAVLAILLGVFFMAGSALLGTSSGAVGDADVAMGMAVMSLALGVVVIFSGVVDLVIGLFGLRGAKNPAKIGVFFVLCIIGLVLGIISVISGIAQGTFSWSSLISLALVAVCTYLAAKIRKQA